MGREIQFQVGKNLDKLPQWVIRVNLKSSQVFSKNKKTAYLQKFATSNIRLERRLLQAGR